MSSASRAQSRWQFVPESIGGVKGGSPAADCEPEARSKRQRQGSGAAPITISRDSSGEKGGRRRSRGD